MSTHVPQLVLPVTPERDHIRGPVTAPITLLEYGDYECPYCGAAHPIVHEVRHVRAHDRGPPPIASSALRMPSAPGLTPIGET